MTRVLVTGIALTLGLAAVPLVDRDLHAQQSGGSAPVRQNPNIDRPITNEGFDSAVIMLLQKLVAAYGPIANSNDRPNPYRRV